MQLSAFLSFASQVEPKHVQSQSKSEWTEEGKAGGGGGGGRDWGQGLANGNRPRWPEREGFRYTEYPYMTFSISKEGIR